MHARHGRQVSEGSMHVPIAQALRPTISSLKDAKAKLAEYRADLKSEKAARCEVDVGHSGRRSGQMNLSELPARPGRE